MPWERADSNPKEPGVAMRHSPGGSISPFLEIHLFRTFRAQFCYWSVFRLAPLSALSLLLIKAKNHYFKPQQQVNTQHSMNSDDASNIWNDAFLNDLYEEEARREKRERPVQPEGEKEADQEEEERAKKRQRGESYVPGELPEDIPHLSAMWDGPTGDAAEAAEHSAADIQPDSGIHSGEGTSSGTFLRLTPNDIQTQCPACLQRLLMTWHKLSLMRNSASK